MKKEEEKKDLKKIDELLLRYNVSKKMDEKFLKEEKKPEVEEISELTVDVDEDQIKQIKSVDYNIIKDDLSRLESYQELMTQYKLNDDQMSAVADIYSRAKENEHLIDGSGSYKSLSQTAKELTNLSKRIIDEISGNYIKSIDEYRSM